MSRLMIVLLRFLASVSPSSYSARMPAGSSACETDDFGRFAYLLPIALMLAAGIWARRPVRARPCAV